jgi:putative methyltransferase (TIGR04325 family)
VSTIVLEGAHRAVERMAGWPGVEGALKRRYDRMFEANREANLFRGVFATFDEAQASAPATLPLGYDNPASAAMYLDRTRRTYPTDYPVLFWLQRLLSEGCTTIFDLGGHIGVSYYAYRRYLAYPASLRWRVHDVPAVMEQGRKFALEKDKERHLGFCDRFEEADGMQVLAAQGSLQYLPETLAERLSRLASPPRHVLLNLTPLHERESFFTLQSVGTAFCPYRITATGEFLKSFESLGYALADSWENPDKKCEIPFHPGHSLDRYYGFYFRRAT